MSADLALRRQSESIYESLMPLFEVFIPAAEADGFDITARIKADSWIQALRNGLARLGDTADVRNVLCDITEDGIHVTEPKSGRVFRIRELSEGAAPPPATPPAAAPVKTMPPPVAAGAPPPASAVAARVTSAAPPPVAAAHAAAPAPARPAAPPPSAATTTGRFRSVVQDEVVTQTPHVQEAQRIGRVATEVSGETPFDDLIAELFDETQKLYACADVGEAARFILALAQRTVPAESGAVFISDINRNDLYFASASGPKANEVMKFRVAMGQGIVGFCAQEGVSLAVSDVHRDPRFYANISKALGYETRSILCSPAQLEGRVFGALELINRSNGSSFTAREVDVLNYLAHAFADYLVSTGQTGD